MRLRACLARAAVGLCALLLSFAATAVTAPSAWAQGITQTSPTTDSIDVAASTSYTQQLNASGGDGSFTWTITGGAQASDFTMSSSGLLATTGTLAAGGYTVSGTIGDADLDAGTWTYDLTVTGDIITQTSPTTDSIDVAASTSYTQQLNASGGDGSFTWTITGGAQASDFTMSSSGLLATTGTLAAGGYTVSGTIGDADLDAGTWTYDLTVTGDIITQTSPTTDSIDVAASTSYTQQLNASGGDGSFTWTITGGAQASDFTMSSSGLLATTGTLAAGGYTVSGTIGDADLDAGTWTYDLTVTGDIITQTSPTTDSIDVAASTSYTQQLNASGGDGSFTWTITGGAQASDFTMSSSGLLATTGTLAAGGYTVSGTIGDADLDAGTWTYDLTVNATTLAQASSTSGMTSTAASATFNPGPISVLFNTGPVIFVQTSSPDGLTLTGNLLATTGTLGTGSYAISGTDHDAFGDTGSWTYTLTVTAPGGGGGGGGGVSTLSQTSPTSGTTTMSASATFAPGTIAVANNVGPVSFVTVESSSALKVSTAGLTTTTGTLTPGTYTVSGTDSDGSGDTGTWTYTLTVTGVNQTVIFDAHGGTGTMTPEKNDLASALTLNAFTRSGYTFVNWNTDADGTGTSYANGATYSFSASITLYAQWKVGKAPTHTVTFVANGGGGSMATERDNTGTALTPNRFTRTGYLFTNWNTRADGSGTRFADGATYPFTTSTTLFAQWTKVKVKKPTTPKARVFTVSFNAHGGKGTMVSERHAKPERLTPNRFSRMGYRFNGWDTVANGSGTHFANQAMYSFTASGTLYAQWRHVKTTPPPPINALTTIGPFAAKSFILTPALQSRVDALANLIKSDGDKAIVIVGYGDKLTAKQQSDEVLWAANVVLSQHRASSVASYLNERLAALGVKSYTISSVGNGSATPNGSGSAASQSKSGFVIATLS